LTLPKYVTQEQRLEDLENIQDQRIKDLEDIAYLKKRVAELEKNQEKIIIFLIARFSQKAAQLKALFKRPDKK
jgi:predicted DNA binding CopG/RHH family protein